MVPIAPNDIIIITIIIITLQLSFQIPLDTKAASLMKVAISG